ncbi:DedA family protein [Streptomyces sp. T1317-0309]|nr:DedA family protein [Streptomyces sp. T1317-0309]
MARHGARGRGLRRGGPGHRRGESRYSAAGEIVLVSAALLSSQHSGINPVVLGACASLGAVVGDSIGYAIGARGQAPARLARQAVPQALQRGSRRHRRALLREVGMWAVFFGRFIALLRIFAGPLAGVLRMPYWKFLTANLLGGVVWAGAPPRSSTTSASSPSPG